jgi:plasmid stability protein
VRTTIDIPDHLYRRLKVRAAKEGQPAKSLILRAVDQVLAADSKPAPARVRLPIVGGKRPGSIRIDHDRLYDLISFP